jgi:hypothetical protein
MIRVKCLFENCPLFYSIKYCEVYQGHINYELAQVVTKAGAAPTLQIAREY